MKKLKFPFLSLLMLSSLILSTSCDKTNIINTNNTQLTEEEVAQALKEALSISSDSVTNWLHQVDGYYKDAVIKILFPPEAIKIKNTLEQNGFQWLVDEVVLKLNRTAEDAAIKAKPIFLNAITNITIQDAMGILQGSDSAATVYLKQNTYSNLYQEFYPKVKESMETVGLQSTWQQVTSTYNLLTFGGDTINTDISDYTTKKALEGIFYKVSVEEKAIREDVTKRVTDLLKKVFGTLDG